MTSLQIILSIAIALLANEILGGTHRLARLLVRWAGRRWATRSGIDHTADWIEDLEHGPPTLFKLFSALWLALSAIVPPERLTLNLPSMWRILRPLAHVVGDVIRATFRLAIAISFRAWARRWKVPSDVVHPMHQWLVLAVASLMGKDMRDRFAEELMAEVAFVPEGSARIRFVTSIVLAAPALVLRYRSAKTPPR